MHFTAFNLLDAVEFVARSLVKPCHVISIITATQTLVVKRFCDIFSYTFPVRVRQAGRLAAFSLFYVVEPVTRGAIQSLQKVTCWTHCPFVGTSKETYKITLMTMKIIQ